jgi:hypothetical protein
MAYQWAHLVGFHLVHFADRIGALPEHLAFPCHDQCAEFLRYVCVIAVILIWIDA